ncbi:MAG: hypothetical protein R3C02_20935, partial [Planctomycetaceae bacterium]
MAAVDEGIHVSFSSLQSIHDQFLQNDADPHPTLRAQNHAFARNARSSSVGVKPLMPIRDIIRGDRCVSHRICNLIDPLDRYDRPNSIERMVADST